jgi:murein DD-endopeptidase MepM/ murein hydrolase activator NlpD
MTDKNQGSYDDMDKGRTPRKNDSKIDRKSLSIIIIVVIVGIVLSLGVLILWFFFFSTPNQTNKKETPVPTSLVINEKVPEPSDITPTEPLVPKDISDKLQDVKLDTDKGIQVSEKDGWYSTHIVKEGEDLTSISEMYGINKESIISVNGIKNLSAIKKDVSLKIPIQNGQLYTVQSGDSLSIITNRYNPSLGWKTLQEINNLSSQNIFPGQKLFIPSATASLDGSLNDYNRFISPFEGRIVGLYGQTVVYGTSEQVLSLQGIWIEGKEDDPIKASATGIVVDTGNNVNDEGRFVVLSHENGYRTKYAHLNEVKVSVSDSVRQGDIIGTMGQSGNIDKTLLYFSIEQDGTALDPANFF